MHVWKDKNKRDRLDYYGRGFTQIGKRIIQTELKTNADLQEKKKEDEKKTRHEEKVRAKAEERHVRGQVEAVARELGKYLQEAESGKKELAAVTAELEIWKEDNGIADEEAKDGETLSHKKKRIQCKEIFEMFDADGSETIDRLEMRNVVDELCIPMDDEELDALFAEIDQDGSGEVEFEEFFKWFETHHTKLRELGAAGALAAGKFARAVLGVTLRLEARRIIVAHGEHEAEDRARLEFRATRPPRRACDACGEAFESAALLQQHRLKGDEEAHGDFRRKQAAAAHRFEPVLRVLGGEHGRRFRLQRLVYSQALYAPKGGAAAARRGFRQWTNQAEPMLSDPGGRRADQIARGQAVEGADPTVGKRAVHATWGGFADPRRDEVRRGREGERDHAAGHDPARLQDVLLRLLLQQEKFQGNTYILEEERCFRALCEFRWPGFVKDKVMLSGEFNGWRPQQMQADPQQRGHYLALELGAGVYQYWFSVDGRMMVDEGLPTVGSGEARRNALLVCHPRLGRDLLHVRPETAAEAEVRRITAEAEEAFQALTLEDAPLLGQEEGGGGGGGGGKKPARGGGGGGRSVVAFALGDGRGEGGGGTGPSPNQGSARCGGGGGDGGGAAFGTAGFAEGSIRRAVLPYDDAAAARARAATAHATAREPLAAVDLAGCSVCDDGAAALASALLGDRTVTALDLRACNISSDGAFALAGALENNQRIAHLKLSGNGIGYLGADRLGAVLSKTWWVRRLDLSANCLGDDGAEALARGVKGCGSLVFLALDDNAVHDDGATALGEMLLANRSLVALRLNRNRIQGRGAHQLAQGLKGNRALKELELSENPLGPEGGVALGQALCANNGLQELKLNHCRLCAHRAVHGLYHLAHALSRNTTLRRLELRGNAIPDDSAKELSRNMERNKSLVFFELGFNEISDVWFELGAIIKDENTKFEWRALETLRQRNKQLYEAGKEILKSKNIPLKKKVSGLEDQTQKTFDKTLITVDESAVTGFTGARREYEKRDDDRPGRDGGEEGRPREEGHWSGGGAWVGRETEQQRAEARRRKRLNREEKERRRKEDDHVLGALAARRAERRAFYEEPDGRRLLAVLGAALRKSGFEEGLPLHPSVTGESWWDGLLEVALRSFDAGATGLVERHDLPALLEDTCVPVAAADGGLRDVAAELEEDAGDKARHDMPRGAVPLGRFRLWYLTRGKALREEDPGGHRALKLRRAAARLPGGAYHQGLARRALEAVDRYEVGRDALEAFRADAPPNFHCELCLRPFALSSRAARHALKRRRCAAQLRREEEAYERLLPVVEEARRAVFGLPTLPAYFAFAAGLREDDELEVFQEPDPASHPVGVIGYHDCVRGSEFRNNWLCISYRNKDEAWVKFRVDKKADKDLKEKRKKEKDEALKDEMELEAKQPLKKKIINGVKHKSADAIKNLNPMRRKREKKARVTQPDSHGFYLRPLPMVLPENEGEGGLTVFAARKAAKKKAEDERKQKEEEEKLKKQIEEEKAKKSEPLVEDKKSLRELEGPSDLVQVFLPPLGSDSEVEEGDNEGGEEEAEEEEGLRPAFQAAEVVEHFRRPRVFRLLPDLAPATQLKVRAKPYPTGEVLGYLTHGQGVLGYALAGDWLQIWFRNSRVCWVLTNFHGRPLLERLVNRQLVAEALERHRSPFQVPRGPATVEAEPFFLDKHTKKVVLKKYERPRKHPPSYYL